MKKLSKGNHTSYLKKEIFMILSTCFRSEVIEKWNKIFNSLDTEGTGKIKVTKLIEMMKDSNLSKKRISKIEQMYISSEDATISYTDFLTKVINVRNEIREEDIQKAFDQLDVDRSGKIEESDINSLLKRRGHEGMKAASLLQEVDNSKNLIKKETQETSGAFTDQPADRNEIGYETFKDYIFGDGDDVSEFSDYTNGSSFVHAPMNYNGNVPKSIKGSMVSNYGSVLIKINEDKNEEAKTDN